MKKIISILLILSILSLCNTAYADNALKKLARGVANIFTCFLEIPKRVSEANTEDGPIAAFTFGILNGFFQTGVRLVVGIYEAITFPVPLPRYYAPILTDPEFFLEEGLF